MSYRPLAGHKTPARHNRAVYKEFRMKRDKFIFGLLALFCAALLLGCPTDADDDDSNYGGDVKTLPGVSLATGDAVQYYSLSTGEAVADPASADWDIAFSRTRLIFTNSGDTATALESGGEGGVWHTGKTVLSDVSLDDQQAFSPYNADKGVYLFTGMGPAPTAKTVLNAMTYVGYEYGDGSTSDITGYVLNEMTPDYTNYPVNGPLTSYKYDRFQYYAQAHGDASGGPTFESTDQVYIIRHGDGTHYSKIQIVYEFADSKDNWSVKYQNF
jgi:hypothetical protein